MLDFLTPSGALTSVLTSIRSDLLSSLHGNQHLTSLSSRLERLLREKKVSEDDESVAGNTTEFVNRVLEKVEGGDTCGGLPIQSVAPSSGNDFDDD
jgi:hypothetical protein